VSKTTRVLVSGLINIETTLRVESFPIPYFPVRYPFFGVQSSVSGVGYNVAKALTALGDDVNFLSMIGKDAMGELARSALTQDCIPQENVLSSLEQTAQSVILYDGEGRRQINVDLKDVQETGYPESRFKTAMNHSDLLVLCNINFSRPFLEPARRSGKPIATDVHALSSFDDAYNIDFMRAAHILFMSHEWLADTPEGWARQIWKRYGPEILVIAMGREGALLAVKKDNFIERIPAVHTRPVVNTIGAGDALFSSFIHAYMQSQDPYLALRKAMVFASYKIGAVSAADGFLSEAGLEAWYTKVYSG
jgi:acarbose 7IV-phosphotransferase